MVNETCPIVCPSTREIEQIFRTKAEFVEEKIWVVDKGAFKKWVSLDLVQLRSIIIPISISPLSKTDLDKYRNFFKWKTFFFFVSGFTLFGL